MDKVPNIFKIIASEKNAEDKDHGIIYHEALDCDLHLVVYRDHAYVEYDFSKYGKNESHEYKIPVENIDEHLEALRANLQIYKNTKDTTGKASVTFKGLRNMTICIHTANSGVCIDRYYFPVATDEEYLKYERDFHYCKEKAVEIMEEFARSRQEKK